MSESNNTPNRIGMVADGDLSFGGGLLSVGDFLFSGDGDTTFDGLLSIGGGMSFLGEVSGNTIPAAGQTYDPLVISYPPTELSTMSFYTEVIGTGTDHGLIFYTYDAAAGYGFGVDNAYESGGTGGGGGGDTFTFTQALPLATWTVNHNLGFNPDVYLTSLGGIEINAEVQHLSSNQTLITFDIPFAGIARFT